jgi:GAF domain-containing protein
MPALQPQAGDGRIAEEQAALRRLATLVAQAAPPEEVFAAVTEEAGRLLHVHHATMGRFGPDGTRTLVAAWDPMDPFVFPIGSRASLGGRNLQTTISQTHQSERIDDYAESSGPIGELACQAGLRAAVGVPVCVEGELWGVMIVGSRAEPLPPGTERSWPGSPN